MRGRRIGFRWFGGGPVAAPTAVPTAAPAAPETVTDATGGSSAAGPGGGPTDLGGHGDVRPIGALVLILGSLSWAIGSFYSRDAQLPQSGLLTTGMEMLGGGALLLIVGALTGALVWKVAGIPITLSTAGGALISGLVCGWLRSVRPTFGRIPSSTVWFMNSVGLNIFIAIVGISAGPGFVNGLRTQGISLFLWGAVATTVPLVLGMYIGKYLFRFHDAILLGIVSGARTTTASLGLVCDRGKSQVPALGYTVTYAVGNTFLTIWGMVLIVLLTFGSSK